MSYSYAIYALINFHDITVIEFIIYLVLGCVQLIKNYHLDSQNGKSLISFLIFVSDLVIFVYSIKISKKLPIVYHLQTLILMELYVKGNDTLKSYLSYHQLFIKFVILITIKISYFNISLLIENTVMSIFIHFYQNKVPIDEPKENPIFKQIIEKLPKGMMIVSDQVKEDDNGRDVVYYNEYFTKIFQIEGLSSNNYKSFSKFKEIFRNFKMSETYDSSNAETNNTDNDVTTLYDDIITKNNINNYYKSHNETIYVNTSEIFIQNKINKIVFIYDLASEKRILMHNMFKGLQSSIILTIFHEINNPLSGLLHVAKEIIEPISERKRLKLFDKIKVLKTFIKIFSENLTMYLKFFFKEKLETDKQHIKFDFYFSKIYEKFTKIYKDKAIKLKVFKSFKMSNPVMSYEFKYFKCLLSNIFIYFYFKSSKKSSVNITMKQKDHKIIIKFKNTCKSKRSNNNVSVFSDTDKSLIEHIENSIQTMSILKEIMVKLSDLMKIKFSLKEKSEVISSINIELSADSCVDSYDEMEDIHELTPSSQMRKNENVKLLKVSQKNTTSFCKKSDINSKAHTLNTINNDLNNSKNESFLCLNQSQPLSLNIKNLALNGEEINKDQKNEENLEEDILKPFMKKFQKYKLVLKPCPLETIRSRGAREDDTRYQASPIKKLREKRDSQIQASGLKDLANILRTEKERILRLQFHKKSNSLKNFNLNINVFPTKEKEQYFESKTKTITCGYFGQTNENIGAESPFTRKCQTNIVMGCSCKKVILVDDENFNIAAVKSLLGSFEVYTDECFNGKELLDKLQYNQSKSCCQVQYTLIFLDLMMPVMGGFEAILKIQELVRSSSLKVVPNIIVLTAHDTARIKDKIVSATFVKDFVAKPVRKSKINELLSKYFFNK